MVKKYWFFLLLGAECMFKDQDHLLFAMSAIPEPHKNWKTMLLQGEVESRHFKQFGSLLGNIHSRSYEKRLEIDSEFKDLSFFETLRLEPFYRFVAQKYAEAAPFLNKLINDTLNQQTTIVHGDYSPKNILVYNDRLILLDHEVIHWGDPAFDIGFSLAHFLSKLHHLPQFSKNLIAGISEFCESYKNSTKTYEWYIDLENRAVAHTIGCLLARVAGRSQVEYLNDSEKKWQNKICINFMDNHPSKLLEFIQLFHKAITK